MRQEAERREVENCVGSRKQGGVMGCFFFGRDGGVNQASFVSYFKGIGSFHLTNI